MSRPHVLASAAVSLDGFLDDASPRRRVLSGPADLDRVDGERAGVDAVVVGAGTVRADDPRLVVRSPDRRASRTARGLPASPLRVVLSSAEVDPAARVWRDDAGLAETVTLRGSPGDVLDLLAARGVVRVLVEGGAAVHHDFLAAGVVDELHLVHAPVFLGSGVRFAGPTTEAFPVETRMLGPDVLVRYRFGPRDHRWLAEACGYAERCPPSTTAFAVGVVIVAADDTVLATGWSRRDHPADHAEETALRRLDHADPRLAGATLYSSLEPCGERASRPVPCAQRIVESGIRRVVTAWLEPPHFVRTPAGTARLEANGIEVREYPALRDLARRPNGHA